MSASTAEIPRIVTTTPTRARRERASFASPTDIKPQTPTARRMSMSSTSQSAAVVPSSIIEGILARPQAVLAGVITLTVLSGIVYSLIHSTSLDTSIASHISSPERSAYFARKSNIVNQWFIKLCWFWTSLIYLVHLFTSPSSRSQSSSGTATKTTSRIERRFSRFAAFLLATAIWYGFTSWFFGAGLGDRVIALSGGACAVPLPESWELDLEELAKLFPGQLPIIAKEKQGQQLYLPLPHSFCHTATALTPKSHPDLFSLLSAASSSWPAGKAANTLHPTEAHPDLVLPRPRWHRGFDISGHTFLLTMSALLLARELAPSWRAWVRQQQISIANQTSTTSAPTSHRRLSVHTVHRLVTLLGTALVALWLWMLLMTAIYFHNPPEKISGLILGLVAVWAINTLTPKSPFPTQPPSRRITPDQPGLADNENAARRGLVVNDGVLEEDDRQDDSPTKRKVK
ncbi:inositol phospholipid synthesis and fat-storage-inducing TM-domain-containing protein [Naematelia encephala]|uniref:Inositol phospholipid synthesis and fat-storage-inducing TM-domain-containing protein n=1 Tax=Naematelia encephala TaxID=71784 RepID=A0A1Y2ASA5_9TREE|nr:inositol phospholipid synthesis and fat-storage-inducing TM-domain-containing protein [Naematelia encephala]